MREPVFLTRSRDKIAADNQAELEGWLDERAAELVAGGMHPDDARRQALAEFGDVQSAARYAQQQDVQADLRVRASIWIEEHLSDLRIATRTLLRTPTVTSVVLLTFALGVGAATSVFSVVHAMLLRDLPYGDESTLVFLPSLDNGVIRPGLGGARHSAAGLVALQERTTSFAGIAGASTGNVVITADGDPEQVFGASLTSNAFEVLQVRAAIGRTFGVDELSGPGSQVVVLLDDLWRRRFHGDSAVVGRTIDMSAERRVVIGVMPPGFRVPTYEQAEYLVPQNTANILRDVNNSQIRFLRLFARLKSGISITTAQAEMDRAMRTLQEEYPRTHGEVEARVVPIRTAVTGAVRPRLLMLMGAAAFVLLIACANVSGVLLARALARANELAVRIALGAGRRRLVRQFLVEGAVLAILGAAFGLLVAQLGIVALRQTAAAALPHGIVFTLELRVVLFAIAAAALAAMASSLVPALAATRVPGVALRRDDGRTSLSRGSRRLRLGLVAGQLAIAVVLLVGGGLFLRTLQRLSMLDLGYDTERTLTFRAQFTRPRSNAEQDVFWESLYDQLRAIPGVVKVGGGNVPMSGNSSMARLEIEGQDRGAPLANARITPASDDYFAALGIPLIQGRVFNASDRDGAPWVAVISARLAKQLWPGGDGIGARVKVEPTKPWATVVGIVGDVRMGSSDEVQPSIYTSQRQDHWPAGGNIVLRASGDPSAIARAVRDAVKRVDPSVPMIGLRTLEEFRRNTPAIAERRMQMQLMLAFALVALAVSAIGVYGVSAYTTEARRREFGIRMALGAQRRNVLWLALRDGAHAAVFGALAGLPLALALAARLRDMLDSTPPYDPTTLGVVVGALFLVVLAASLAPARRATLVDPAKSMRVE